MIKNNKSVLFKFGPWVTSFKIRDGDPLKVRVLWYISDLSIHNNWDVNLESGI